MSSARRSHDYSQIVTPAPAFITTSGQSARDQLWDEAVANFKKSINPKTLAKIASVHSVEELLSSTKAIEKKYKRSLLQKIMSDTTPFLQKLFAFFATAMIPMSSNLVGVILGSIQFIFFKSLRHSERFTTAVEEMFDELCSDLNIYGAYQALGPPSMDLDTELSKIYNEILKFCACLIESCTENWLKSFYHMLGNKASPCVEVHQILQRVKQYHQRIQRKCDLQLRHEFRSLERNLAEASVRRSRTAMLPCILINYPPNPNFFGRDGELKHMQEALIDSPSERQKTYILQGMAGVGKSELAMQFAYTYAENYSAVFWIFAATEQKILASYKKISEALELEDRGAANTSYEIVKKWLRTTDAKWLVVLDNVCGDDLEYLQPYLPVGQSGTVVITTRDHPMRHHLSVDNGQVIEPLTILQGSQLLQSLLCKGRYTRGLELQVQTEAIEISKTLGGLPLAISQIAGFLIQTDCSFKEFLEIYKNHKRKRTLNGTRSAGSTTNYAETIATLYTASITRLAPGAKTLLELLAFYDPDGFPETFMKKIKTHNLFNREVLSFLDDELEFRSILGALKQHFLVTTDKGQGLSVHRLVQSSVLDLMDVEEGQHAFDQALFVLSNLFPNHLDRLGRCRDELEWETSEKLLPHVLALVARYKEYQAEFSIQPQHQLATLVANVVRFCQERGLYRTAISFYEDAHLICTQVDGSLLLASVQMELGSIYRNTHKPVEAEKMFTSALRLREAGVRGGFLDKSDPALADIYSNRGNGLLALSRIREALESHLKSIEIRRKHPEQPHRLALGLLNLGWTYLEARELEKAEKVLQESLQISRVLGSTDKHPGETSWALRALGNVRIKQKRFEEAYLMHREAFEIQAQLWGMEHNETGDLCHKLAYHHHRRGEFLEAMYFFPYRTSLTLEHALTRDLSMSSKCLRSALAIYSRADADTEPNEIRSKYFLSIVLYAVGNTREAAKLKEEASIQRKARFSIEPHVDDTTEAYNNLVGYWAR